MNRHSRESVCVYMCEWSHHLNSICDNIKHTRECNRWTGFDDNSVHLLTHPTRQIRTHLHTHILLMPSRSAFLLTRNYGEQFAVGFVCATVTAECESKRWEFFVCSFYCELCARCQTHVRTIQQWSSILIYETWLECVCTLSLQPVRWLYDICKHSQWTYIKLLHYIYNIYIPTPIDSNRL